MIKEDELIEKVKSWPECNDGCEFKHHMVDIHNPDYKISFCGFEMEAIAKGTRCAWYKPREK